MKRAKMYMTKPTGRKPMRIGAILLKEVPYKDPKTKEIKGWLVDLTWRGAETESGRGHKTKNNWRHAEEFAAKENKRLDVVKERGLGRFTFSDACDSFLKRCDQRQKGDNRSLQPESFDRYQSEIENQLRPHFGPKSLATITSREIEDFFIGMGEKYSAGTVDRRFMLFNLILDHAVHHDMIAVNPLRIKKVKLHLGGYKKRVSIPDRSDLEVLRQYLNTPRPLGKDRLRWSGARVFVMLGASAGMRVGEVCGLRWDSIDPVTGEIDVRESIAPKAGRKGPKTEAGYRKIPTTLRARAILEDHAVIYKEVIGKCVGSVLLTQQKNDFKPSVASHWFEEIMTEAGLSKPGCKPNSHGWIRPKFTFHALRHWCASHWMKATGGDVHQVAKWMGHKNASMTLDIYGHCLDDPEARAKFERIPDWLDPVVSLDTPIARPALAAPDDPVEFDRPEQLGPIIAPPAECPIHIPDIAKPWLKPFVMMLVEGVPVRIAYERINPQLESTGRDRLGSSARYQVLAEFKRLKLGTPQDVFVRLRSERIIQLHEQGYQALDISRMVDLDRTLVTKVVQSRHKERDSIYLKTNRKLALARKPETQREHKPQLKLL